MNQFHCPALSRIAYAGLILGGLGAFSILPLGNSAAAQGGLDVGHTVHAGVGAGVDAAAHAADVGIGAGAQASADAAVSHSGTSGCPGASASSVSSETTAGVSTDTTAGTDAGVPLARSDDGGNGDSVEVATTADASLSNATAVTVTQPTFAPASK